MAQDTVHSFLREKVSLRRGVKFDGDEMNLFLPQSPGTVAEMSVLTNVKNNIMTPRANKPSISIIQDALLGSFLLTRGWTKIRKEDFCDAAVVGMCWECIDRKFAVMKKYHPKRKTPYWGKVLFSLLLPDDLNYRKENKADPKEPIFEIRQGVIISGAANKAILGDTPHGLIQILYKEYGNERCAQFITNLQRMVVLWICRYGFSIGWSDCLAEVTEEVQRDLAKARLEIEVAQQTEHDPRILELRTNIILNRAKDMGHRICQEKLRPENRLKQMVESGSKGNYVNIAQITSILGQQNMRGRRIEKSISFGTRSLPQFRGGDDSPAARGFVSSSYRQGLNPAEFWFHAVGGREGLADTAIRTADSGYLSRRMVKSMEDARVHHDGTVRTAQGAILQFAYGEDGMDGAELYPFGGKPFFADVHQIAARLNNL